MVDQSDSNLPDPSVTDLGACLKAGVDLKQVNSKILGTQSVTDLPRLQKKLNIIIRRNNPCFRTI